ncbi:MAG: hypothetical protein M3232_02505, partial [Thermoproteota archaeon]|nr:hypothetical protein [Thermoproteota archaeon]
MEDVSHDALSKKDTTGSSLIVRKRVTIFSSNESPGDWNNRLEVSRFYLYRVSTVMASFQMVLKESFSKQFGRNISYNNFINAGRFANVNVDFQRESVGITVKKNVDFSEWYGQVVLKTALADYAPVKGFIVLRPYGYAIWESIRDILDKRFKETGHQNGFLPVLIPESLLAREEEHFAGFTPEVFWVTKAGDKELDEKLALRPTSETLAYSIFAKWVTSYRNLPLKINFWNSALRAEIKSTKPLIRTSEFLWQEGHTVHTTEEEAEQEVMSILKIYKDLIENYLAVPVIAGYKT